MDYASEINILVVDDNKENLKVVSNYLKGKGYNLALALNGDNAFTILKDNKIDLILLDIMMPGMDGFEVCRILKEDTAYADIPVIFLTAKSETDDIVRGFQLGGVDYITKPFRKEELFARVNNQVKLKLVKDLLKLRVEENRKSKEFLMRVLFEIGNIIDSKH